MTSNTVVACLGLAVGFLVGMIGHEYAHARVADALGDKSIRFQGRLGLNPRAYLDPLGTIILPAIFTLATLVGNPFNVGTRFLMFGYARPVPVQTQRLRRPREHAIAVFLAGPLFNLALGLAGGAAVRALDPGSGAWRAAAAFTFINVILFMVNILPIPSLDGARILARFLSPQAALKIEELGQYGLLFLLLLVLFPPLGTIVAGLADPFCTLAAGGECTALLAGAAF